MPPRFLSNNEKSFGHRWELTKTVLCFSLWDDSPKKKNIHEIIAMMETAPRETVLVVAGDGLSRNVATPSTPFIESKKNYLYGYDFPKETPFIIIWQIFSSALLPAKPKGLRTLRLWLRVYPYFAVKTLVYPALSPRK